MSKEIYEQLRKQTEERDEEIRQLILSNSTSIKAMIATGKAMSTRFYDHFKKKLRDDEQRIIEDTSVEKERDLELERIRELADQLPDGTTKSIIIALTDELMQARAQIAVLRELRRLESESI